MILELAGRGPDLIHVTAQYSNAVLVALLPYFSDVAHKLDLPVAQPITMQHVVEGRIMPYRYPNGDMLGAGITVNGGWAFGFQAGYVNYVELWPSYFTVQDPDDLRKFYGVFRMSKEEAIQMGRTAIKKLGIPLEAVFAELEPRVRLPERLYNTNTLPYYRIEWLDPRSGSSAVDIGVNAEKKRVERIQLQLNENLRRSPPKIDVATPPVRARPSANPEYALKLLPIVLRAVDEYGKALGLPIPSPLNTNCVTRFQLSDNGGWPHSVVELTNGWQFVYRNSMVNGYYAPDNLFWFPRKGQRTLVKDYAGRWNVTEAGAIKLIKQTLAKLNYPTNLVHMDFAPQILKPSVPGIPRYFVSWEFLNATQDDIESKVEAEVDADKGELKSLYFDHKAFWNKPPSIDVPLSLAAPVGANGSSRIPVQRQKSEPRVFKPPGSSQQPQTNRVGPDSK
ncbi:MAG TPA: hypothetical protein VFZ59_26245 [Verrucomicrobiae bacterium]|nr:hypothetical protein [Verrucomicrobiae bacterium]